MKHIRSCPCTDRCLRHYLVCTYFFRSIEKVHYNDSYSAFLISIFQFRFFDFDFSSSIFRLRFFDSDFSISIFRFPFFNFEFSIFRFRFCDFDFSISLFRFWFFDIDFDFSISIFRLSFFGLDLSISFFRFRFQRSPNRLQFVGCWLCQQAGLLNWKVVWFPHMFKSTSYHIVCEHRILAWY